MVTAQLLANRARRRALGLACAPPGAPRSHETEPPAAAADPVLLAWLVAEAMAAVLLAALAVVLIFAGWRPAPAPVIAPALGPPSSLLKPDVSALGAASSARWSPLLCMCARGGFSPVCSS